MVFKCHCVILTSVWLSPPGPRHVTLCVTAHKKKGKASYMKILILLYKTSFQLRSLHSTDRTRCHIYIENVRRMQKIGKQTKGGVNMTESPHRSQLSLETPFNTVCTSFEINIGLMVVLGISTFNANPAISFVRYVGFRQFHFE